MKMKPSLDVENIADFKQYYEGGYIRLRENEEVVHIELVRAGSGQVAYVPCFSPKNGQGKMTIVDWVDVPRTFLFGKVPSGMCDVLGKLGWRYQQNNRTGSRGYHPDEYRITYLAGDHCDVDRPTRAEWDRRTWNDILATEVFAPRYTALQAIDPNQHVRAYALNHLYGVGPEVKLQPEGKFIQWNIFRRSVPVGRYDPKTRTAYFKQAAYDKYAIPFGRMMGVQTDVERK